MKKINSCVFCWSDEVQLIEEKSDSSKYFYIQCNHCAARGSSYGSIINIDGIFEEDENDLIQTAIDTWNNVTIIGRKEKC